jgi:sulfite reductase (ferredoxin)
MPKSDWSHVSPETLEEIDVFETELGRFLDGSMPEKVFLEFRLRHGVYGQRQAGVQMLRIKIPLGRLTADQCEALADLSEEYADGISHITTRQDVQFHFVDIHDTPNLMRRLAAVDITTKEACGNVVRNVTCCPDSGVCTDEAFDVTPHAHAMAYFLLRHPDAQNFGRKFKIAFSGCAQHHCGLARMHDIGAVAKYKEIDGEKVEGFEVWVGGGLGATRRNSTASGCRQEHCCRSRKE